MRAEPSASRGPWRDGPAIFDPAPGVLGRLDAADTGCAVWCRDLDPALQRWLAGLVFPMPRQGRWTLPVDAPIAATLRQRLSVWLLGAAPLSAHFVRDIAQILQMARDCLGSEALSVRLDVVSNDGCRLFHADRLRARWICTYRGPGTQWLPDAAVDYAGIARGTNDHVRDWTAVRQLQAGWVAALRGDQWPGAVRPGLLHRSPPASPAQPRIVLAVDAA